MSFPVILQHDHMDCGPTCLQMISKFYGKSIAIHSIRERSFLTKSGSNMLGLTSAAESIGFRTLSVRVEYERLEKEASLPCILHWNDSHFVVLPPQKRLSKFNSKIVIIDPALGIRSMDRSSFLKEWYSANGKSGVALLLEPTPDFSKTEEDPQIKYGTGISFLKPYLSPYFKYFIQLIFSLLSASILALILPFLTQALVDNGINRQNFGFIKLVLFSQVVIFIANIALELIRNSLLLHVNSRISIAIVSDFLKKLMSLRIDYFDSKTVGDILQRIADHSNVESFLTNSSLPTLFSILNIFVFSVVLAFYNWEVLLIFLVGSFASIFWIVLLLKKRKNINYERFKKQIKNQDELFETITGMQEIKLNSAEVQFRWGWERLQASLFKINLKMLSLAQIQNIGSTSINQLKNILVTYYSAKEVLSGDMTLGMMLSISYIIGFMNSPIEQFVTFLQSAQDAKLSLDRISEIHNLSNKGSVETESRISLESIDLRKNKGDIEFKNVSFHYGAPGSPEVLNNICLNIPYGKTTAIVGLSGSGKTTLMKLLLQYYEPSSGTITVGSIPLERISTKQWWEECGAVMSDGFIFSQSIARNISLREDFDSERLALAGKHANLDEFVSRLPSGYMTKIGNNGLGLSSGQKLRILIARAIYRRPHYLLLDEATSTLDAINERTIISNIEGYYKGRTIVVIAHRLSTVRNADQIVVLKEGRIVETGTHSKLIENNSTYFSLIRNQIQ